MRQSNFQFISLLIITALFHGCDNSNNNSEDTTNLKKPVLYLNDTGVVNYTQTFTGRTVDDPLPEALSSTPDVDAPGQDAHLGRDRAVTVSDNDGKNGFTFSRLDSNGNAYAIQPTDYNVEPWSCVRDENTRLIWEVKTLSGLQAYNNAYSWYSTDANTNGGHAGSINDSASCQQTLSFCNTQEYIAAINNMNDGKGLCGLNNWRLPLREELRSIIDYSMTDSPMIDTVFFPNTMAGDTWTAQTAFYNTTIGDQAWEVHFNSGYSEAHAKSSTNVYVRLVHDPVN